MKSALEKRFSPPHRKNMFRAVFRQQKRESKESLMSPSLVSSSSLDEAISLATQYESFEMGESIASINSRLKIKGRSRSNTKTTPVQNECEANAASFDKLSFLFDKKFEALNKQVTTSLAK